MEWLEIQVRVPVGEPERSGELVALIGDAVAAHTTPDDRPWFMTSEIVDGRAGASLRELLATRRNRAGPAPAAV
jgi:hypothetical protein